VSRWRGITLIEAGAFWMGSDGDDPNEAPSHRVYVRDFGIDRDKVTNPEFARFLNAWGTKSPEGRGARLPAGSGCATSEDLGGR
jgi:formylglycine-generating enzyme required for sulfatase activity